jgi:hypothetical protein
MALFDFLKRKPAPIKQAPSIPPAPGGAASEPVIEAAAPPPNVALKVPLRKPTVIPADVPDFWAAVAEAHEEARARGLQLMMYSHEPWSPGAVALRKFMTDPLGEKLLAGWHVIEIRMQHMDVMNETPSFKARGLSAAHIPQLWTFDAEGGLEGFSISGGYWGSDTMGNIANGLQRWFANRAAL